jgi:hypothetical protein
MRTKVLIEGDAQYEAILRRALARVDEREQLALTAPDGTVFEAREGAVLEQGQHLQGTAARPGGGATQRGRRKQRRRSASAPAVGRRKTAVPKSAD